jgi:hypothetical protein
MVALGALGLIAGAVPLALAIVNQKAISAR